MYTYVRYKVLQKKEIAWSSYNYSSFDKTTKIVKNNLILPGIGQPVEVLIMQQFLFILWWLLCYYYYDCYNLQFISNVIITEIYFIKFIVYSYRQHSFSQICFILCISLCCIQVQVLPEFRFSWAKILHVRTVFRTL